MQYAGGRGEADGDVDEHALRYVTRRRSVNDASRRYIHAMLRCDACDAAVMMMPPAATGVAEALRLRERC